LDGAPHYTAGGLSLQGGGVAPWSTVNGHATVAVAQHRGH
jgi:hypothetical protein